MSRKKSGYDAVVDGIMKHPEIDAILAEYEDRCKDPNLVSHSFGIDYENIVNGYFTIQFGPTPAKTADDGTVVTDKTKLRKLMEVQNFATGEKLEYEAPRSFIQGELDDFIDEIWGTDRCKTYNCDRAQAKKKAFEFLQYTSGKYPKFDQTIQKSIHKQIGDLIETDAWKDEKTNFLANKSKVAIIDAMRKFPDVADEVFQTALEEFIAERVIED